MSGRFPVLLLSFFFLCTSPAWPMAKRPPVPKSPADSEGIELTLQECYRLALARSEDIAIQRQEIEKTKAQFMRAAGEAIGDGNFVITDTLQDRSNGGGGSSSVGSTFSAEERRERKFTFSQPIFQGFKSVGAVIGAGSLRKQKLQERRKAEETLFLDVAHAFYAVLYQAKDVEVIKGILALYEERIGDLWEREKIGRSRTSEVVTAETGMKILEAQMAHSEGQLAVNRHVLAFFIGLDPEPSQIKEESGLGPKVEELDYYLKFARLRSDVEAVRQAMRTAWQNVIVKQSNLWPKVTLEANQYQHREGFQSDIDWDVLFKVDVPLFTGGTNFGNLKESVAEWKQAKLVYAKTQREAELQVQQAYENWASSAKQAKAYAQALKTSEENYRLQKEDYNHNLVSNLDVLQALESLFNTSRETNRTHFESKEDYEQLGVALGRCCEQNNVIAPKGLPRSHEKI